jgi:hypothetical protein
VSRWRAVSLGRGAVHPPPELGALWPAIYEWRRLEESRFLACIYRGRHQPLLPHEDASNFVSDNRFQQPRLALELALDPKLPQKREAAEQKDGNASYHGKNQIKDFAPSVIANDVSLYYVGVFAHFVFPASQYLHSQISN